MFHNWCGDGIQGGHPRIRYGEVHLFNNLCTPVDASYAVRCADTDLIISFYALSNLADLSGITNLSFSYSFPFYINLSAGVMAAFGEPEDEYIASPVVNSFGRMAFYSGADSGSGMFLFPRRYSGSAIVVVLTTAKTRAVPKPGSGAA